jgi:hypothetical protein
MDFNYNPNNSKPLYSIRYTMKPDQIFTFVSGLHDIQLDMIDEAVTKKEQQGFPEATAAIKRIMEMK